MILIYQIARLLFSTLLMAAASYYSIPSDYESFRSEVVIVIILNCVGWLLIQIAVTQRYYLKERRVDATSKLGAAIYAFFIPMALTNFIVGYPLSSRDLIAIFSVAHLILFSVNQKSWFDFVLQISKGMSKDAWIESLFGEETGLRLRGLFFNVFGFASILYMGYRLVTP